MTDFLPPKERGCHRTGFERKCRELVAEGLCQRWVCVRGQHPQTGKDLDTYGCAEDMVPMLLIENSRCQRETRDAVLSFRDQVDQAHRMGLVLGAADRGGAALPALFDTAIEPVKS